MIFLSYFEIILGEKKLNFLYASFDIIMVLILFITLDNVRKVWIFC